MAGKAQPPSGGGLDPQIKKLLDSMSERIDVLSANRGDPLDRAIIARDLLDIGLAKRIGGRAQKLIAGVNLVPTATPPSLAIPPKPANFTVSGGLANIFLTWDNAREAYSNHAYTAVFRNTADNLANAIEIAQTTSSFNYADLDVHFGTDYYYWIRFVSTANIMGPPNSPAGTLGKVSEDPAELLERLSGEISRTQLASDLATEIDDIQTAIDSLGAVFGDTSAAAASAAQAAASATQALGARADAVQAKADAITAETSAIQAKNEAIVAKGDALTSATAASSSATSASTSAATATTKATESANSATSSAGSASSAATSATTAANSATAAGNSASAASTSATNAAASATSAGTSASAANTSKLAAQTAQSGAEAAQSASVSAKNSAESAASAASTSATLSSNSATAAGNSATAAASSATSATTSATNAATSAAAAESSKISAQTSASSASNSASSAVTARNDAAGSASAANASAVTAANSATAAGNSASAASTSATDAATSATSAGTSASVANSAKLDAQTSAGSASTSATNAANSSTGAASSASSASTSATNAANSATSAGNSASAASGSASTATTKATEASNSATSANTARVSAESARDAAAGSATAAATSASTATTKATEAQTSANSAATSATTATTKAGEALTYRNQAAQSVTDAAGYAAASAVDYTAITARLNNVGGVTLEQKFDAQASSISGLYGQYTLKVDVNGRVSGFGLASTATASAFIVNADKFAIARPGSTAGDILPFIVDTTPAPGFPNGRVVMDGAFIKNATITDSQIGDVNVSKVAGLDANFITGHIGTLNVDVLEGDVNKIYTAYSTVPVDFGWELDAHLPIKFTRAIDVSIESQTRPRYPVLFLKAKIRFPSTGSKTIKIAFIDRSDISVTPNFYLPINYTSLGPFPGAGSYIRIGITWEGIYERRTGSTDASPGTHLWPSFEVSSPFKNGVPVGSIICFREAGSGYVRIGEVSEFNHTIGHFPYTAGDDWVHGWWVRYKWVMDLPLGIPETSAYSDGYMYVYTGINKPFVKRAESDIYLNILDTAKALDVSTYLFRGSPVQNAKNYFVGFYSPEVGASCDEIGIDTMMVR